MSEHGAAALLTVDQAIAILDAEPVSPRARQTPIEQCLGLRLARDVLADRDYPPFRKSVMDGYAVRSADLASGKAELRVVGKIAAGTVSTLGICPGEAMAIMTGALLPAGADGVVPVEEVQALGAIIRIERASDPQRHVAPIGSDCPAGKVVLSAGARLGPAQIAVLASVGAMHVDCFVWPRVSMLATGDELAPPGQSPGPAQIRDCNTPMLAALLERLNCQVVSVGRAPDDPEAIRQAIRQGLSADALFITGGMSMGEFDYVPRLLLEEGIELKIAKLRIKPGKPFVFGRSPHTGGFVFGLPGNPVAGFVCTHRLASRLLTRMAGGDPQPAWISGVTEEALPSNGPREFYQPVISQSSPRQTRFKPLAWKGSADVFTLGLANALLIRRENEAALPAGSEVRAMSIDA